MNRVKWILALFLAVCVSACATEKDPAKQHQKDAAVVIDALRKHHEFHNTYPGRLEDLDLGADRQAVDKRGYIYYRKDDHAYTLRVVYSDQGTKACEYDSVPRAWTCGAP